MSAVIVKGIIISLSVVAAVGIALQTPEVREWLDEQRRKLAELLRSVSDGLDADTRREAEAFAFEGRIPSQRESGVASHDALALATGRQLDSDTIGRRLTRQTSLEAIDAAERRRLGREYLARRNQEMLDMKRRHESGVLGSPEGNLKDMAASSHESQHQLMDKPQSSKLAAATLEAPDHNPGLSQQAASSTHANCSTSEPDTVVHRSSDAFHTGAEFGNPFADEFSFSSPAITDRSTTPKPPLPPKVPVSPARDASPISIPVHAPASNAGVEGLTYDEQLARALSLSLADKEEKARKTLRRTMTEEEAFARAIVESLKDNRTTRESSQNVPSPSRGPLVDLSAESTYATPAQQPSTSSNNPWRTRSDDEDLYFLTPMPTGKVRRSRLLDNESGSLAAALHEYSETAASEPSSASAQVGATNLETSETASPDVRPASPSSATLSPLLAARDVLSSGFHTESETEDHASLPGSSGQSVASMIEVEDVGIESFDEDDDGVATPSSWSEISSQMDESESGEHRANETAAF